MRGVLIGAGVVGAAGLAYLVWRAMTPKGEVTIGEIVVSDAPIETEINPPRYNEISEPSFVETVFVQAKIAASTVANSVASRGYRNNNPGNIRYIANNPWNGQVGNDKGYGIYDTMSNGTRALGRQLLAYEKRGLNTVQKIVSTWAPTTENDTSAYISHVASLMDLDPNQPFSVADRLPDLARAIARHENGYINNSIDFQWVYL